LIIYLFYNYLFITINNNVLGNSDSDITFTNERPIKNITEQYNEPIKNITEQYNEPIKNITKQYNETFSIKFKKFPKVYDKPLLFNKNEW